MSVLVSLMYSIIIPCLFGYILLLALIGKQRFNFFTSIAISFGLGLGVLTQCMLLLGILGITYSTATMTSTLIILGIVISAFSLFNIKGQSVFLHRGLSTNSSGGFLFKDQDFWTKLLVLLSFALIIYYGIYMFWAALNIPVYTWDSIATSVYNAKILSYEKSLTSYKYFIRANYPLHVPMVLTWISINLGGWNDQLVKIVFPLIFVSFAVIFHLFLNHYTDKKWALFGVAMLFSSNLLVHHASISYRDVFLLYYNCSTIMFLIMWKDLKHPGFLGLASLFAGFATFTKLEGTAYFIVYCLLMIYILYLKNETCLKDKIKYFLRFLIPGFSICLIYYIYKMLAGVSTSSYLDFDITNVFRNISPVLRAYYWAIFLTANWNIIWVVFIISLLFNYKRAISSSHICILLIALFMFLGIHLSIAMTSGIGSDMINPFTISRIILHFFPLSILLIMLLNSPQSKSNK